MQNQDDMHLRESVGMKLTKRPPARDDVKIKGTYKARLIRDGKEIWSEEGENLITTEGINYMLNVALDETNVTQAAQWYMGIATDVDSGVDASTGAQLSGTGAVTEMVDYDNDSNRNEMEFATAAARAIAAAAVSFVFDTGVAGVIIEGGFVCAGGTAGTQGASATTLWAIFKFGTPPTVNAADQLDITYTVTMGSTSLLGVSTGAP